MSFTNLDNLDKWPLFISFYTVNTGYENEIKYLLDSLKQFNLPYDLEGLKSTGNWVKNCAIKPSFIYKKLNQYHDTPIVWLDADSVVKDIPTLFDKSNTNNMNDIMCGFLAPELLSGTIYIKNNTKSKEIVSEWNIEQQNNLNTWDQKILQTIQQSYKNNFSFLPHSYIKIFDNKRMNLKELPIIQHNQASRRFKNNV